MAEEFNDAELEDLLAEFEDQDGGDNIVDSEVDSRNPITTTFKKAGKGFKDAITTDPANIIEKAVRGAVPTEMTSETDAIINVSAKLKDELVETGREIKSQLRPVMSTMDRLLPENSKLKNMMGKLLGDDNNPNSNKVSKEQMANDNATAEVLKTLGQQRTADEQKELFQQALQHKKDMNALELSSHMVTNLEQINHFNRTTTTQYYSKMLWLKHKSLFFLKDLVESNKAGNDIISKQLEIVAKNTALPDFVKLRSKEAMEAALKQKLYDKNIDSLLGGEGWLGGTAKKLSNKIKNVREVAVGGIGMAGDMLANKEMMQDMGMDGKEMAGGMAAEKLANMAGRFAGAQMTKDGKGKNAVYEAKSAFLDPKEMLKQRAESATGMSKSIFSFLSENISTGIDRKNVNMERLDPDAPAFLTRRMVDTTNIRVPKLLSLMLDELKELNGKKGDSVRYDESTGNFVSKKEMSDKVHNTIKNNYLGKSYDSMNTVIGYFTENKPNATAKVKQALIRYLMSPNTTAPKSMLTNEFASFLPEDIRDKVIARLKSFVDKEDKEEAYRNQIVIKEGLDKLRESLPDPNKMIAEFRDNGNLDILEDSGIVNYNESKREYEFNNNGYDEYVSNIYKRKYSDKEVNIAKNDLNKVDDEQKKIQEQQQALAKKLTAGAELAGTHVGNGLNTASGFIDKHKGKFDVSANQLFTTAKDKVTEGYNNIDNPTMNALKKRVEDEVLKDSSILNKGVDNLVNKIKDTNEFKAASKQFDKLDTKFKVKDKLNNAGKKFTRLANMKPSEAKQIISEINYDDVKAFTSGQGEALTEFMNKHKFTREEALEFVNKNFNKIKDNTLDVKKQLDAKLLRNQNKLGIPNNISGLASNSMFATSPEALMAKGVMGTAQQQMSNIQSRVLGYGDSIQNTLQQQKDNILGKDIDLTNTNNGKVKAGSNFSTSREGLAGKNMKDSLLSNTKKAINKKSKFGKFMGGIGKLANRANTLVNSVTNDNNTNNNGSLASTAMGAIGGVAGMVGIPKIPGMSRLNPFDRDGSGRRDGSWQDRLASFSSKNNNKDTFQKRTLRDTASDDFSLMGIASKIFGGFSTVNGLLGKVVKGVFKIGKFGTKALPLLGTLTKGIITMVPKLLMGLSSGFSTVTRAVMMLGPLLLKIGKGGFNMGKNALNKGKGFLGNIKGMMNANTLKALGKSGLKKIPLIGALAGAGFAAKRLWDGDFAGAGGEALSGLVSLIPGIGTMGSVAVDAWLANRDRNKADEEDFYIQDELDKENNFDNIDDNAGEKEFLKNAELHENYKNKQKELSKPKDLSISGMMKQFYKTEDEEDDDTESMSDLDKKIHMQRRNRRMSGVINNDSPEVAARKRARRKMIDERKKAMYERIKQRDSKKEFDDIHEKEPTGISTKAANNATFAGSSVSGLVSRGGGYPMAVGFDEHIQYAKHVNVSGLNPKFADSLARMASEYESITGKKLVLNSAFRDPAYQKKLYDQSIRQGKKGSVAPPGRSLHNFGLAVDMPTAQANELDKLGLMRKYGLTRPVGGETWHVEPIGLGLDLNGARRDANRANQLIDASLGKGGQGWGTVGSAKRYSRNANMLKAIMGANVPESIDKDNKTDAFISNSKDMSFDSPEQTKATPNNNIKLGFQKATHDAVTNTRDAMETPASIATNTMAKQNSRIGNTQVNVLNSIDGTLKELLKVGIDSKDILGKLLDKEAVVVDNKVEKVNNEKPQVANKTDNIDANNMPFDVRVG